jgi:hypothetical protein
VIPKTLSPQEATAFAIEVFRTPVGLANDVGNVPLDFVGREFLAAIVR